MKKILFSLFFIMLFGVTQSANAYGLPAFVYGKFKAFLKEEAAKVDDGYRSYYFFTPQTGVDDTPVMFILAIDSNNRQMTLRRMGVLYENDEPVFKVKPIAMSYNQWDMKIIRSELYVIQDLDDGRGEVARRIVDFYDEPIDRGPAKDHQNLLSSGIYPNFCKVSDFSLLNQAFSQWM